MSEKRFILSVNEDAPNTLDIIDVVANKTYNFENDVVLINQAKQLVDFLNEQQTIILNLKLRLEKINGGYGHLTHKKGLTPNEWLLSKQERELKEKDEQISDWIEQHGKDIARISEQQAIINTQKEAIKRLKCMNNQLERRLDYSIAYDMGECE